MKRLKLLFALLALIYFLCGLFSCNAHGGTPSGFALVLGMLLGLIIVILVIDNIDKNGKASGAS